MSEKGEASRRSRTPSIRVQQNLIEAAEAVLIREGAAGLTVRAVAQEAKVAPMGVYNRLGSKAGLINLLLIRGFDRLRVALETVEERDPLERLRWCALRYRRFAIDHPAFYAIMFEDAIQCERDSVEVSEHAAATFRILVRNIESASVAGRIDVTEPQEVAQQLWSAMHGAVIMELRSMIMTPNPESTYLNMTDTMLRGLR